jgi:hypothetical protein
MAVPAVTLTTAPAWRHVMTCQPSALALSTIAVIESMSASMR